ncbi:MAG: acylphosphatase, partial [Pseudomonadota bacterium]
GARLWPDPGIELVSKVDVSTFARLIYANDTKPSRMTEDTVLLTRITGRVQGVWFRAWTQGQAESLGLRGWVRNEPDGSVAALLMGPKGKVRDLVRAFHHGPPAAKVERVDTVPGADDGSEGFRITG